MGRDDREIEAVKAVNKWIDNKQNRYNAEDWSSALRDMWKVYHHTHDGEMSFSTFAGRYRQPWRVVKSYE
jgi:hypothetical protein